MTRPHVRALALAAVASLALGACQPAHTPRTGPEGPGSLTRGIDAAEYVRDYESAAAGDSAGSVSESAPRSASAGAPPPLAQPEGRGRPRQPEPGPLEDNTFREAGTSGFVDAGTDAASTFALDVDSGSFGVARTLLAQGLVPPAASIRVEEWVNAMPYADPAPTDADLGVRTEAVAAPGSEDTQLVRVAVGAREVTPADRPRVNLTLVVDRSGSMDVRERLGLVQSSLALLADRLREDDTVSLVSFEDQARPLLAPTPVSETERILDAVERLTPGGSTHLEAGLALGYDQAREAFDPGAVNLVVLASDGVANVGATGPGSITERIAEEGAEGIHLVTVGYGMGNYNDHLMEQLADLGDGFYAYVDTFEEAERLFGSDLVTTLTPVAAQARAQVRFDPEVVEGYRLVGYENREIADEDFADLDVDAGELGAGHRATALYEVRTAPGVAPGTVLGEAEVRWRPVGVGGAGSGDGRATSPIVTGDPGAAPSSDLALADAVADLALLVKGQRPVADPTLTLGELRNRVQVLADRDVRGAEELLEMARDAVAVVPERLVVD
ncbi:vWA domain-containing protein [Nocardioides nanhaiensis]|uniref:VWFA domain-containing protein n=1 Tax=Nocardioides nanhaiensis TaxID=1476871 RepID=A0ABP8WGU0_9ACTN